MLEARAREIAAEWGLVLGDRFESAPWSYVAAVGTDAVLKVRADEDWESDHDVDALVRWDGHGAVRVLRHDRARRAALLQRADPGFDLASVPWDDSIRIAAAVARQLWVPAAAPFPSIHEFIPRWLDEVDAPDPVRGLYARLDHRSDTLVHGDLHHHNLLRDGARWVAIDSKAMRGEPAFDVAPLMWNPIGSTPSLPRIQHCLDVFAAAGLDPGRVRAWALIRATYLGCADVVALLDDGRTPAR